MRIVGVAVVLAAARVAALAGHDLAASLWSPVAYLWQDAAVLLVYLAIDRVLRRTPRIAWLPYVVFVAYVAVSVPMMRVMSTPMTWAMWRAAGGALGDSIWLYATAANLLWIAGVVAAGVGAPVVVAQGFSPANHAGLEARAALVAVGLTALGPSAIARVDTRGLDRNPWSALASGVVPRVTAASASENWRAGRTANASLDSLARFRGAAANRNVILVGLESTAAQYLSLYGAAEDAMPTLSALARSAVVFDRAYAAYPESIKGLFSILCSAYPALDRDAGIYAGVPCRSIASHAAARGYHTALFHSGRFGYLGMDAVIRNRGYHVLADAGDIGGERESSFGVDDHATAARILNWIDALPRGDRFFVTYLPIAGHHPYEAPDAGPFPARDEFGRYRNALHYGDTVLAALARGLAARGLDRRTVWIVYGDHGEAFGQHDGNFGHTFQLYEENVHVPLLIAAPGLISDQIRARRIVSLIDIAPTILDLLNLPDDEAYQGSSALREASGMALFSADYSLGLLGLRDGTWKYIYELESGRSRLFDLDRDPAEAHDIAGEHPDDVRWYAQRVRAWSAAQRARLE